LSETPSVTGYGAAMGDGVIHVCLDGSTFRFAGSLAPSAAAGFARTILGIAGEPPADEAPVTDPYVRGWLACAETTAILCEVKADELTAGRRTLAARVLNPSLAAVYRHAAEIARATTVVTSE